MAIYTNEHLMDLLNEQYERVRELEDEGYKMSAELEWYKRFHDYTKSRLINSEVTYYAICMFLFSEERF